MKTPRFISAILAVLLLAACIGSTGEQTSPAVRVSLTVDGNTQFFQTTERQVAAILAVAEVELAPGDRVLLAGIPYSLEQELPLLPVYFLQVRRAYQIELVSDAGTRTISSAAATLGGALLDGGITLFVSDRLDPPPETPLTGPLSVTLTRARPIQITVDDQTLQARTAASTVGLALAEAGLALQGLDYSVPPESEPIPADGQIRVVRISEQVIIQQEPLPFQSLFQPSDQVDIDTIQITQTGEFGITSQRVRVRYEDGVEISRQVEAEWVAREPVPRIQAYGTKITIQTMQTPHGQIEYWRAVEVYATSFAAKFTERAPSDPNYGRMYNGIILETGYIAVLRAWYPSMAGRQFYVPNYGYGEVGDIGGGFSDRHWIDLGFSDDEYVAWFSYVTFYFLTPVPPADQILWILP